MLIPYRHKSPPEAFPFASCALILLNFAVYGMTRNGWGIDPRIVTEFGLSQSNTSPIRFVASLFLHANFFHVFLNAWFLYLFGFAVEGRLKWWKFTILYFVAGACGNYLFILLTGVGQPNLYCLGASSSVIGLMAAAIYLFPYSQVNVYWVRDSRYFNRDDEILSWRLYSVAVYYLALDVLIGFIGKAGVPYLAHYVGAIGGLLMCFAYQAKPDTEIASDAKATLVDTGDASDLTLRELDSIVESQPDDVHLAMAWLTKSLRSGEPVNANGIANFQRLFPEVFQHASAEELDNLARALATTTGLMRNDQMIELALRCEQLMCYEASSLLLLTVINHPQATEPELETTIFRFALISETYLLNRAQAANAYADFLKRFPVSPMAGQAEARLEAIQGRRMN